MMAARPSHAQRAPQVIGALSATLRRAFAGVFSALAREVAAPDEVALRQLRALLDAVVGMLHAEEAARGKLAAVCPDSSFGSQDLAWAAWRLIDLVDELEGGAAARAAPAHREMLDYLSLFHGEMLVALHARQHDVPAWLASAEAASVVRVLLDRYEAVRVAVEDSLGTPAARGCAA